MKSTGCVNYSEAFVSQRGARLVTAEGFRLQRSVYLRLPSKHIDKLLSPCYTFFGALMKNRIIALVVGMILLLFSFLVAQAPDTLWTRTYGLADDDYGRSVIRTYNGGYAIVGYSYSFSAGFTDAYFVKTDANGNEIWWKTYKGLNDDYGYSIQQTSDSGYIIAGWTDSFGAGFFDVWLIKTDANGDTMWTRTYGGVSNDESRSVQLTLDGGYIITGYTASFGAGGIDFYLIKTDSMGDTIWTKTYGGVEWEWSYSVQQTSDGGYIIVGYTTSFGAGGEDVYIIKADSMGDTIWTRTYGGISEDIAYSVQQTLDSGYIVVGITYSFGVFDGGVYLIKTDTNGDTIWTKIYGGIDTDIAYSIQQTPDSGYIIAGETNSFGTGSRDVYLLRTDANGNELWSTIYGGDTTDIGYSVQPTSDGGYIIAGQTESFGSGRTDFCLIKTEPDPSYSEENEDNYESKNEFVLKMNPCESNIPFSYCLTRGDYVSLIIYNIIGQEVKKLVGEYQISGRHDIAWDARDEEGRNIQPGVYFARLKSREYESVKKLVLVR
jgi:hypothetical protein